MYFDVISKKDKIMLDDLHKLGFDKVLVLDSNRLYDAEKDSSKLTVYSGPDYKIVIQKHKFDIIADLELHDMFLNKGLCSKLKENGMFVIFKLKNLIASDTFFKVYKNTLINSKLCYDFGVDCLFISFSQEYNEIKSPIQLVAFAEHMGYHFDRLLKSYYSIEKAL